MAGKFLVLWKLELSRATPNVVRAVLQQQDYGARLLAAGKLVARYHLVGGHGGAWIYNVESDEELDNLLAQAPVYNMRSSSAARRGARRPLYVVTVRRGHLLRSLFQLCRCASAVSRSAVRRFRPTS